VMTHLVILKHIH